MFTTTCPNCGTKAPWTPCSHPVEVWCASCCLYNYEGTGIIWRYDFIVLPVGQKRRPLLPGEDRRWVYGGWNTVC